MQECSLVIYLVSYDLHLPVAFLACHTDIVPLSRLLLPALTCSYLLPLALNCSHGLSRTLPCSALLSLTLTCSALLSLTLTCSHLLSPCTIALQLTYGSPFVDRLFNSPSAVMVVLSASPTYTPRFSPCLRQSSMLHMPLCAYCSFLFSKAMSEGFWDLSCSLVSYHHCVSGLYFGV